MLKFSLALMLLLLSASSAFAEERLIAVVMSGKLARYEVGHESFMEILRAGGLLQGKVRVYVQSPNPDPVSLANSIRKAVGIGADLIVTHGAPATLAAQREAKGIPVLFASIYDPSQLGIRPAGSGFNGGVTGVSCQTPLETLIKIARDIIRPKKIGILWSRDDLTSELQRRELARLGNEQGIKTVSREFGPNERVETVLTELGAQVEVVYLAESSFLQENLSAIMDLCAKKGIPVISQIPGVAERGGVVSLEADPQEQGQLLGFHAMQVLSGQKPEALPVRTPKKVSLVINLKVAHQMNRTVPFEILTMATRVIK